MTGDRLPTCVYYNCIELTVRIKVVLKPNKANSLWRTADAVYNTIKGIVLLDVLPTVDFKNITSTTFQCPFKCVIPAAEEVSFRHTPH